MKTKLGIVGCSLLSLVGIVIGCSEPTHPLHLNADNTAAPQTNYAITDLGNLGGGSAVARAINDSGQVVGRSQTVAGEQHAFLWTAATGMTDLGTLGGGSSQAFSVNDLGHVVGSTFLASG